MGTGLPGDQEGIAGQTRKPLIGSSVPPGATPVSQEQSAPHLIASSRLLDLGVTQRFDELVGREVELELLTRAWHDPATRILVLVAEGGEGKTSLVAQWLTENFIHANWAGVEAFFDWSFYSQGTRDQSAANSGQFLDTALRHFRETALADSPISADQKAEALARCVARQRALLVLDGVEPLQHPDRPGGLAGRFKDVGIGRLLKALAQMPESGDGKNNDQNRHPPRASTGLCIVTSRVPLVELKRFHASDEKSGPVREYPLDHLSFEAAARLLHGAGARRAGEADIRPDDDELLRAAEELKGHALTCQLLGGYLKHVQAGDIRRRDRVDWTQVFDVEQEGHAWQVMRAYERWFAAHGEVGRRQLAVLRLLGLFDRPADAGCLTALRRAPAISGLTEPLVGLSTRDWTALVSRFAEEHRLLSVAGRGEAARLDAHPLIRAYFAQGLVTENPMAGTEGHRRLFEHLTTTTEHRPDTTEYRPDTTEYRPDTLEGLQPLYQAVAHGCRAGLHQQALEEVYRDRILRGMGGSNGFYSYRKLGALSEDLGAVACFFRAPWERVVPDLSPPARAWVFGQAAFCLQDLGRLAEARAPLRVGLKMYVAREDWHNAAIGARNLSRLESMLGELAAAMKSARDSIGFVDRSGSARVQIASRVAYAHARYQAGRRAQAERGFREAERLQVELQPQYPRLYSVDGFWYCALLLTGPERAAWWTTLESTVPKAERYVSECDWVAARATETRQWAETNMDKSGIALDRLTLGRAGLYRVLLTNGDRSARLESPAAHLDAAVDGLRRMNRISYLPHGLLSRSWLRCLRGERAGSVVDLEEAWDIAERGPMPLFQADILLTRARLFWRAGDYPWGSPRADLKEARRLVEKHGYHRRDGELRDAEEVIGGG
uniref:AAA ATPase domain-containing protein n=1 Tax=Candidatus Kentrum sp. FW TaxID=2126338 RepID=A0A450S451_9GAMM|nr:MAG: hypothetical protein BECKFW1821B_GA0114236_100116 [Candidatus Kentron sp. FW]